MVTALLLALVAGADELKPPSELPPPPVGVTPWPTRRDAVEIHFIAYDGADEYTVKVGSQSCTTPCTLVLKPGPTKMTATGSGDVEHQLVIPHSAAQVRVGHVAPGWYKPTGAVMLPVGIVLGASLWAVGLACGPFSDPCLAFNLVTWPVIGASMLVMGAVLLGQSGGRAPIDANRAEILDARRPGLRFRGFSLAPLPGGFAGGLGFSF
ncbi:MAG: hypothetical protein JNK82_03000 [Myxococcaceae bacterium]|nr:hypothetical protein [Myxococcaceae bacterium]